MRWVEIGSSAEAGSSSSRISRLHRDRPGDAQPLLLAAGQAEPALPQLVLDLVPQRGAAQCRFDAVVELGFRQLLVEPDAESDVVVDRHRKRRRLLEHHADLGAQQIEVEPGRENVLAVDQHLAGRALPGIKLVDAVEDAQQGRLAAARRADEGGHPLVVERQVDVLQCLELVVVELDIADQDLLPRRRGRIRLLRQQSDAIVHRGNRVAGLTGLGDVLHEAISARADVEAQDRDRDQQRAAPGKHLPVGIGAHCELEDDDRQIGHRGIQIGAPELVVEGSE